MVCDQFHKLIGFDSQLSNELSGRSISTASHETDSKKQFEGTSAACPSAAPLSGSPSHRNRWRPSPDSTAGRSRVAHVKASCVCDGSLHMTAHYFVRMVFVAKILCFGVGAADNAGIPTILSS